MGKSHGFSQVKRLEEESAKALEEAEKAAQAARDAAEHALQATQRRRSWSFVVDIVVFFCSGLSINAGDVEWIFNV